MTMHARTFAIALGALLLSLGLAGGANATLQVDVEYNLDETTMDTFFTGRRFPICNDASKKCSLNGSLGGTMTVRYTGTSAVSGTGIKTGVAELRTFHLTLNNAGLDYELTSKNLQGNYKYAFRGADVLSGTIGWHLSPATATGTAAGGTGLNSLTTGGQLKGTLTLRRQMSLHCLAGNMCANAALSETQALNSFTDETGALKSPQTFTQVNLAPPGTLSLSRTANGDLRSGTGSGIGAIFVVKGNFDAGWFGNWTGVVGNGQQIYTPTGKTTVPPFRLVGREVNRAKVPEPGSLLLLGSGLAGLVALGGGGVVGRRLRRRHEDN